jgi:hypothetical protein
MKPLHTKQKIYIIACVLMKEEWLPPRYGGRLVIQREVKKWIISWEAGRTVTRQANLTSLEEEQGMVWGGKPAR